MREQRMSPCQSHVWRWVAKTRLVFFWNIRLSVCHRSNVSIMLIYNKKYSRVCGRPSYRRIEKKRSVQQNVKLRTHRLSDVSWQKYWAVLASLVRETLRRKWNQSFSWFRLVVIELTRSSSATSSWRTFMTASSQKTTFQFSSIVLKFASFAVALNKSVYAVLWRVSALFHVDKSVTRTDTRHPADGRPDNQLYVVRRTVNLSINRKWLRDIQQIYYWICILNWYFQDQNYRFDEESSIPDPMMERLVRTV